MRFICAVLIALVSSVSFAQSPFPARNVLAGQTVVVQKGDYLLTTQCTIQPGGRLVIEAGANVKVDGPGNVFYNRGSLEINGTQLEPVRVFCDAGKNCGTLFCQWSSGPRPQLSVSNLDWTTTINANCFFLQATDFTISNSRITNRSVTTQPNRVCIAANTGSVGVINSCYLDGCSPEITKPSIGVVIGNGVNQTDSVEFFETAIANTSNPLLVKKPSFALVSGTVE